MKFWLTTQWPPTKDSPSLGHREHIWLKAGKEQAGSNLKPGDLVFIYEYKTGKPREDKLAYWTGRQRIVTLAVILDVNLRVGFDKSLEKYHDGSQILWKLVARTRTINNSYSCSRNEVCECLEYSQNSLLRGFGKDKSGLKELTEAQFGYLLLHFK
jgi:hypothetical protein